ncbi:hypothetical protein D9611_008770 [Ephemerocybe angulata]|uniref:Fcf2 pre-rRNA processing C-terminal domain-containing protein n=1 Tax=Ephemerocybe angulata TaxID=980116 RepID=A0A8H5FJE4_9AGAR|nr:hypothetical protein D9611_008770 [Tulosesus angulatus]
MASSTLKGKERAIDLVEEELSHSDSESGSESDASSSSSSSGSSSDSGSDSDDEPEITKEYLDSLLAKAKENALKRQHEQQEDKEEEILTLEAEPSSMPSLDPGNLPTPYLNLDREAATSSKLDPEVLKAQKAVVFSAPQPPPPPPELNKDGKPITKREKKAIKKLTAGPDWFNLPAPAEADLPRLHREVEAMRLHNQLDPKRFYRKEEGEGKGIKGLPKYFAIGKIVTSNTPFNTGSTDNLTRAERKRTLVDELVDDAEARRYAKRKFNDLQTTRGARGRGTLQTRQAARRGKW